MGHRIVRGLKWAELAQQGPPGLGVKRPRGAKREGLRYEAAIASAFGPLAKHGQWIKFEDQNGLGWAQPDILFPHLGELYILEAKYTWVPEAHTQIELLYKPLLECIFSRRAFGIVICKVLTIVAKRHEIVNTIDRAMAVAPASVPVLHWIGSGPLFASPTGRPLSPSAIGV